MPVRRRLLRPYLFMLAALLVAACQPETRVEYLMEVTREVTREVTVVVTATPDPNGVAQAAVTATEPQMTTATATLTPTPLPPTETLTPQPTADIFPTPITEQIVVAEQLFEGGRMFYISPNDAIWVMIYADGDETQGEWLIREDTWQEGDPEFDPALEAETPDGFFQPERGFGKLWRENPDIQEALGWAVEPEFGHVTFYSYYAGGEVVGNEYIPGPGSHAVVSRYGGTYIFIEGTGTWQLAE